MAEYWLIQSVIILASMLIGMQIGISHQKQKRVDEFKKWFYNNN